MLPVPAAARVRPKAALRVVPQAGLKAWLRLQMEAGFIPEVVVVYPTPLGSLTCANLA